MIAAASFPPHGWGGAEVAAEGIARWLASQGHVIAIYSDVVPTVWGQANASPYACYGPHKAAWSHRAHEHGKQNRLRKLLWHALDHAPHYGEADFGRAAADFRPDIVMVHLAPGLGLGIFAYCAAQDIPVLFVLHDFWMTCLRSSMFSSGGAVCVEREWSCRWSSARRLEALFTVPRLGFWAPSHAIVKIIEEELGQVFRHVLIERNVVDLADFSRTAETLPAAHARFLYAGKLTEAKGVPFVLECLASLPREHRFEVNIVGGGELEESLRAQFASDARFRFHGVRRRADMVAYFQEASVLLVPSLWFENSPLVIYQAQAAGLPVVASNSGGIPELLQGRADSFVLRAGDRAAWTQQLLGIVSDPLLQARLRHSARHYASVGSHALDARGRRVEVLCRTLINPARPEACTPPNTISTSSPLNLTYGQPLT